MKAIIFQTALILLLSASCAHSGKGGEKQLPDNNGAGTLPVQPASTWYEGEKPIVFNVKDDYPHISNWTTTQNSHVAVRTRMVYALMEAEGKHGDNELKRLIETLDEDANPVLQVMIFHDVDQVKR